MVLYSLRDSREAGTKYINFVAFIIALEIIIKGYTILIKVIILY